MLSDCQNLNRLTGNRGRLHPTHWLASSLKLAARRELCKNGRTDGDAVWVVDSGGSEEACVKWRAHWRHLANMTEMSMFGGPAKTAEPIEMPFVLWTWVGPKSMHYHHPDHHHLI